MDFVDNLLHLKWQKAVKDLWAMRDPVEAEFFDKQDSIEKEAVAMAPDFPNKDPRKKLSVVALFGAIAAGLAAGGLTAGTLFNMLGPDNAWARQGGALDHPASARVRDRLRNSFTFQISVDVARLEQGLEVAGAALAGGVTILEMGTPLLKNAGVSNVVPAFRQRFPDALLLADMKTMDGGAGEARAVYAGGGNIIDFLALAGDAVDNIPGVPGIGPKSAAALLNHFDDLDSLFDRLDEVAGLPIRGASSLQRKLREHRPAAELARRLTGIEMAVESALAAPSLTRAEVDTAVLNRLFDELAFGGMLRQRCLRA